VNEVYLMKKTVKRIRSSRFLGKQLSRLKMGQSYYAIITSTINAVALVSLAFEVGLMILIFIFPLLIFTTFLVGYYLDVRNINSMDSLKSNEMAHRFLNTGDLKSQEFQLMQTKIIIEAIIKGKQFDVNKLKSKYEEYVNKWKPPEN